MNIDILDSISELTVSIKKEAAILEAFTNTYTNPNKKDALLAIESHFENFQYMAHVLEDLMHEVKENARILEEAADAECEKKCG